MTAWWLRTIQIELGAAVMAALALAACSDEAGEDVQQAPPGTGGSEPEETRWSQTVRVEGGTSFQVRLDPLGEITPDPIPDPLTELSGELAAAVDRAPSWVRARLARTLWSLPEAQAAPLAAQIMTAQDAWVDEVAWSIAVTDRAVLSWIVDREHQGLFVENAQAIYRLEGQLAYASLVERDDDRTTLQLTGDDGSYELEPELYYWHVVYPRAYLELPAYRDGVFWRPFFLEDASYGMTAVEAVADAPTVPDAANQLGEWIQSFMEFGYGTNDLWPTDVYHAQYGSCGQYSILTTAAARAVLIPTLSVSARADDHEWNEFWDGRWIMWDNSLGEIGDNPHYPYIDWPEIFDDDSYDGSGVLGEVAHVYRFRGDEYVWPSDLYTEYKQVYVDVLDADGRPVQGARVVARTAESGMWPCIWSYTDPVGRAELLLGDDLRYGFSIDQPVLGELPKVGDPRTSVVTSGTDTEFFDSHSFGETFPRAVFDLGPAPDGDLEVSITMTVEQTELHQRNVVTEPYELGQTYPVTVDGGLVDAYLVDESSQGAMLAGEPYGALSMQLGTASATVELTLPSDRVWHFVVDNRWWPDTAKDVALDVTVRY